MHGQDQFISFLQQIHPLEEPILQAYLSSWEEVHCTRREVLVAEGETEKYMYFVLDGIQRSYFSKDEKEHVIHLTYSPALIAVPESFLMQLPSRYTLECITSSRLLRISYQQHQAMMDKYPEVERLIRKALELIVVDMVQRHHELMAFTIEERYASLMQRNPKLINLVPHKYLASFLRIDPSNFSRLLNQHPI
ncbi:Crp/Fnr family transcriptional regulator [Catalinimonas sp. 4WD22]|uniref:Crp/Fnr family transcriptional regulator n=1 Tax=Catalinimonas locisalis TaxID=3133978 RepID=UPI003101176C